MLFWRYHERENSKIAEILDGTVVDASRVVLYNIYYHYNPQVWQLCELPTVGHN